MGGDIRTRSPIADITLQRGQCRRRHLHGSAPLEEVENESDAWPRSGDQGHVAGAAQPPQGGGKCTGTRHIKKRELGQVEDDHPLRTDREVADTVVSCGGGRKVKLAFQLQYAAELRPCWSSDVLERKHSSNVANARNPAASTT